MNNERAEQAHLNRVLRQVRAALSHVPEPERPSAGLVLWHIEQHGRTLESVLATLGIAAPPAERPHTNDLVEAGHLMSGEFFFYRHALWQVQYAERGADGRIALVSAVEAGLRRRTRTLRLPAATMVVVATDPTTPNT